MMRVSSASIRGSILLYVASMFSMVNPSGFSVDGSEQPPGDVGGADHWSFGKVAATPEKWDELPKQKNVSISAEGDTITQKLQWEDSAHKPMLDETRTVKFGALADGSRTVDITSVFSAVD